MIDGRRRSFGPPVLIDGFRLVDARASYGISLPTFALGFPVHFDWSWRDADEQARGKTCSSRRPAAAKRSAR